MIFTSAWSLPNHLQLRIDYVVGILCFTVGSTLCARYHLHMPMILIGPYAAVQCMFHARARLRTMSNSRSLDHLLTIGAFVLVVPFIADGWIRTVWWQTYAHVDRQLMEALLCAPIAGFTVLYCEMRIAHDRQTGSRNLPPESAPVCQ